MMLYGRRVSKLYILSEISKKNIYMKQILVIIMMLLQVVVFAQKNINKVDAKGNKVGLWEKKYENSDQIRYLGHFKNNKEIGEFKFFDKKGNLTVKKTYYKKDNCKAILYNKDGGVIAEGDFVRRNKKGEWRYYDKDSNLIMIENYTNGILNGNKKTYYENGNITEDLYYVNGELEGKVVRYTKDGHKISELNYKKGILQGTALFYDGEGKNVVEGKYIDGQRAGKWKYFDDDKEVRVVDYDKDIEPAKTK